MSTLEIHEPPRKKQKISSTKSISRDYNTNTHQIEQKDENEIKNETKDESEHDEAYFYNLHINPDIILLSTDPEIACNTNFDIEYDMNTKPNLFIVQKTVSTYNENQWLDYHTNKTNDIQNAANLLCKNNLSLLIVTGAGMGCDSNLPDYRSAGGFWRDYKPLLNNTNTNQLSLYDMSKTDWFTTDPLSAWGFYTHRAKLYRNATPHHGFNVLFNLTVDTSRDYFYMTSNIDGQAIKAGFQQNKLYQTHGSLHHLQCLDYCQHGNILPFFDGYNDLKIDMQTFKIKDLKSIPNCNACKGLMRPNVSFFTDTNDTFNAERIVKQKHKFMEWLKPFMDNKLNNNNNMNKELLVLEIGCGKSVHSLRWECEHLASLDNVTLIRINPTEDVKMDTREESKHIILKLGAKAALNAIHKCRNK